MKRRNLNSKVQPLPRFITFSHRRYGSRQDEISTFRASCGSALTAIKWTLSAVAAYSDGGDGAGSELEVQVRIAASQKVMSNSVCRVIQSFQSGLIFLQVVSVRLRRDIAFSTISASRSSFLATDWTMLSDMNLLRSSFRHWRTRCRSLSSALIWTDCNMV